MKTNTMKLLSVILILSLLLAACGGGSSDDPNAGTWVGVSATMLGIEMEAADLFPDGISLELQGNGKGKLIAEGDSDRITWTYEDGVLTIVDGDESMTGTIDGDTMTLVNLFDTGMDLIFVKE